MSGTSVDPSALAAGASPAHYPHPRDSVPMPPEGSNLDGGRIRFLRALLATTIGTVFVILFGAVVRITGSGAGCGQHWPTCQGEIAHIPATLEALIEYTHRLTSGLAGLAVLALVIGSFRVFPPRHPVRVWCCLSGVFMLIEALIGMLLVRLSLIGDDASVGRAVVMPLHLANTLLLLGALALSLFFCWPPSSLAFRDPRRAGYAALGLLGVLLVSASGALTALGDTIYPARAGHALLQLASDQAQAAHFLERARALHPILAILLIGVMWGLLPGIAERGSLAARHLARISLFLFVAQAAVGIANILMSAPGGMQVLHLFVSSAIWLSLVLLSVELWKPRLPSSLYGLASGSSLEAGPRSTRVIR